MADEPTNEGQSDGGALRAQLEKALKDLKAVQEQNDTLSAKLRATSVKELFGELKADARGVKFYTGEPTKEALAEWLKGDGDVFATAPQPQAAPETPQVAQPAAPAAPGLDPVTLAAMQAVAGMQPQAPAAPSGDLDALANTLSTLPMDKPEDGAKLTETWQAIRAQAAARLAAGGTF